MEVVDYDKISDFNILIVRERADTPPQGYILRFAGESGRETRICCSPEELKGLGNACLNAT